MLLSHSFIISMFIFVVVEKLTKKGAKVERELVDVLPPVLLLEVFGILKKNFSVLNSLELRLVSVL